MSTYSQIVPQAGLTLTAGGSLSDHVLSWRFSWPWHGKATWAYTGAFSSDDVKIDEPSPLVPPGSGAFGGKIRSHRFDRSRTVIYQPRNCGMTGSAMILLGGRPSHDGRVLSWSGEDCTAFLEKEGTTQLDILMKDGVPPVTYSQALLQMGALAGINVIYRGAANGQIKTLRRGVGRLLDWMDQIGGVYQCGRRWENGNLIYEPASAAKSQGFVYRDNFNIYQLTKEEAFGPRPNIFTVAHLDPAGGVIGTASDSGGKIIGSRVDCKFDVPSYGYNGQIATAETNVDLTAFVPYDGNGDPITTGLAGPDIPAYHGATLAYGVKFTVQPKQGATTPGPPVIGQPQGGAAYTPKFSIIFTGNGRGNVDTSGYAWTTPAGSTAGSQDWGKIPAANAHQNPIIATFQEAKNSALAIQYEAERHVYFQKFVCPDLNPMLHPGSLITVTDYLTGQSGVTWFVETVHHIYQNWTWNMVLECTRGI